MELPPTIDGHLASLPTKPEQRGRAVPAAVKAYLEEVRTHLKFLHGSKSRSRVSVEESGAASIHSQRVGRRVNEANSDLMDRMIRRLFDLAEEIYRARGQEVDADVAVIAVGGYARREMSIHSDVDLLILYRDELTPFVQHISERLQYWLWDGGLSVGCATRTIAETVALGLEDVTVRTGVLTARFLCGDGEFFHVFADRIRDELLPDPEAFVAEQQELMRERQIDYGDSLYLLQPNVKEGAGALRDYHTAYWVARGTQPSVRNIDDFLHFGLLTETEMNDYREALDFLWWTRNELHCLSRRANDQMSFELQEGVSEGLGYGSMAAAAAESIAASVERSDGRPESLVDIRFEPDNPDLPVERFMRDYYRHARAIKSYSELVIDQCASRANSEQAESISRIEVEDGFYLANNQLAVPHAAHLREDPIRVLRAFAVAQRHQVGLSRMAERLIRENLHLLDEPIRSSKEVGDLFMQMLDSETRVMRTLMSMNDVGLLSQVMPEWAHIVCRWQHVIYHTYTVDVHSIFLVEELRRLWRGKYVRIMPELTELMQEVDDRSVLFLGCLLHDIGKGFGGDHSSKGVVRALPAVERLGLSPERTARVLFVVQHHLLMSHLAQSRDLSDAKLILELAQICGDRQNLRNLYLATFADIRASSVEAWTDWKGQLLRELYERTAEMLETGAERPDQAVALLEARVERRREGAREELMRLGVGEAKISSLFAELPRRYFLSHTPRQIARHAQVVLRFGDGSRLATANRDMKGDFTEFILCTSDVHGLYSDVAGVMTACGLNILGSHVYTTSGGLALEIYRTRTPRGGPEERAMVWAEVESSLESVLIGAAEVGELVRRRRRPVGTARPPSRKEPRVLVSNTESEFYTLVDVIADDRLGLLYDATRTIGEHGFEIYISKAATIKDQVTDTFYLKDQNGKKIKDSHRLDRLREGLLEALGAGLGGRSRG
ncbi:MAG: HD domain-containing protein [Proteobacteria bacterium]|nr:HD domain-containing protein [Pseudomonadota bacterium]